MKKIFSVLALLSILYSCKKDSVADSNNPTPTNDSIYLSKYVALDTTQSAPNDTMSVMKFSYDAQHRIVNMIYLRYDAGSITENSSTLFYYNGSDTLPFKSTNAYSDSHANYTSTKFYQYVSGTRNILMDSSISFEHIIPSGPDFNDTFATHYFYPAADILQSNSVYYNGSGPQYSNPFYYRITRQNGNIVSQVDTVNSSEERFNCTYDSHKNPFYNVAWYNNKAIVSFYKTYTDSYGLNNNVTEINNTSTSLTTPSNVETSHYIYTYKYRSDGYPLEVVMKNMGSTNPESTNKFKYYYTN